MNKIITAGIIALSLLAAGTASAQSYSYPYNYSQSYTYGTCTQLSRDLSKGMRGSDVTALQTFLLSQNYTGSGAWMVTGYFGAATQVAVRNFQQSHGISTSGVADSWTRAAIASSCGNTIPTTPTYPTYPTYPTNPVYPTYPTYPTSIVSITTLAPNSAAAGSTVTIYGTGFDQYNTVYVGSTAVTATAGYNGNSITFVVPSFLSGTQQVYVASARGTSNSLPFTILSNGGCAYTGTYYGTGNCYNPCTYGYGCNTGTPTISYLNPSSGGVNSTVTIIGSGFSTNGNTIHFGTGVIANIISSDGNSVSFTVPTTLTGYGTQQVVLGTYPVYVTNASGVNSNTAQYTVTSVSSGLSPVISSVNGPTTLQAGVSGTWTVNVNTYSNQYSTLSVSWGDTGGGYVNAAAPQTIYSGTQTATFTHSYYTPGTYTLTFTVSTVGGQSNVYTSTIYVTGGTTYGQPTLSYVAPSSGRVGTQVTLSGTGFTQNDNTVHFGVGGAMHLVATNGNTIYFTIPSYVSQCDVMPGTNCFAAQQVAPGTYQVYVTNSQGQSNQLTFTVTY